MLNTIAALLLSVAPLSTAREVVVGFDHRAIEDGRALLPPDGMLLSCDGELTTVTAHRGFILTLNPAPSVGARCVYGLPGGTGRYSLRIYWVAAE